MLAELVGVAAGAGDLGRAEALAEQAEAAAQAINDRYQRARALADLVEAAAGAGYLDRAEAAPRRSPSRISGPGCWPDWWRRRRLPVTWTGPNGSPGDR